MSKHVVVCRFNYKLIIFNSNSLEAHGAAHATVRLRLISWPGAGTMALLVRSVVPKSAHCFGYSTFSISITSSLSTGTATGLLVCSVVVFSYISFLFIF